jgi:hypothetical protein
MGKNIQGGVQVSVKDKATLGTAMNTFGQFLRDNLAAAGTSLRGVAWVNQYDNTASIFRLLYTNRQQSSCWFRADRPHPPQFRQNH